MRLTDEQKTVCKVFSQRDRSGRVHCRECPMRLDDQYAACLKILGRKEAEEGWNWDGSYYPAIDKVEKQW